MGIFADKFMSSVDECEKTENIWYVIASVSNPQGGHNTLLRSPILKQQGQIPCNLLLLSTINLKDSLQNITSFQRIHFNHRTLYISPTKDIVIARYYQPSTQDHWSTRLFKTSDVIQLWENSRIDCLRLMIDWLHKLNGLHENCKDVANANIIEYQLKQFSCGSFSWNRLEWKI